MELPIIILLCVKRFVMARFIVIIIFFLNGFNDLNIIIIKLQNN